MSENIKVSEVSDILRHQLEGIDTRVQLDEIGTVLQVSDGVARIYGLRNAEANELLEFDNGIKAIVMNLEEDNVGAVLLGPTDKIKEGYVVKRTKRIASIMAGEGMLGRVIDPLGAPLDGKGLIGGELCEMPLERKAPGVIFRQPVNQPLQTGLKAVDAMIPIGRGQRELIIGDRQTGKTAIAIDTIINQRANYEAGNPVYCIYVAIGQKASTVATIVNTLREYGAMDYTIVLPELLAENAAAGPASSSIDLVSGGAAENVVPASASVTIDFRYQGVESAQVQCDRIEKILSEVRTDPDFPPVSTSLTVTGDWTALSTDMTQPLAQAAVAALGESLGHIPETTEMTGWGEGGSMQKFGIPAFYFGPGDGPLAHTPKESVSVSEIKTAVKALFHLVDRLVVHPKL